LQKTDRKDAQLPLRLMREDNFPRIWAPSPENRDLRQLLWHRHRMVQMRTPVGPVSVGRIDLMADRRQVYNGLYG
jgi:hypothetical protein